MGITEILVAEGLSAEVAARGGLDGDTLAILISQYDALEPSLTKSFGSWLLSNVSAVVKLVTVFAESVTPRTFEDDERPLPTPLLESTPTDSVTLVFSDDPNARWVEVCELIDNTLAAAVAKFAQQLG